MKMLILLVVLFVSANALADDSDLDSLQVNFLYDRAHRFDQSTNYADLVLKEEKIAGCVVKYVEDQSKSYSKIPQNDLYDLLNNFDKIRLRIDGKKVEDNVPYEEKLEALADVQCRAYYKMGVLK